MLNDPALVANIRRVLAQAALTVQFQAPGITVTGSLFTAVTQAIESTRSPTVNFLTVRAGQPLPRTGEGREIGGVYIPGGDYMAFAFTQPRTIEEEGIIVHEAVHAICDIYSIVLSVQDFEAVAYIAEEMYVRHQYRQLPRGTSITRSPAVHPIRTVTAPIVEAFTQQRDLPQVGEADMQRLHVAVESVYHHHLPNFPELVNGIPGFTAIVTYRTPQPSPRQTRPRRRPARASQ